ncbi:MAG: hypothetical protein JJ896_07185 [Rhodothermales bacterium]|nr:hypothetical protein [Rhodothermales bacterium]MBO6779421.1 hypothetical protein [Rhodothermales bacterium]
MKCLPALLSVIVTGSFVACSNPAPPAPGVPLQLAQERAERFSDVRYRLHLELPESRTEPIAGEITVSFQRHAPGPVVLDFVPGTVDSVAGGLDFEVVNEHVVIPGAMDSITLHFTAGDASLNRNDDFLYALFVPDRARMAIPVFDQPNLKARWSLSLAIPEAWTAVSNGALTGDELSGGTRRLEFAETEPIPTYLFAFAAGQFQTVTGERDGRSMTMYHRESDIDKVTRNQGDIFDLHAASLAWLEQYTAIDYPFGKFDFVLIPSFQFGGMEHPGAIYYRSSSLMLDENPPVTRQLGRASLIAHETAHMWFGDLVTMDWFDDVWTKEVYANFMAAKIVQPSFPEIDHELRFLLSHYPSAYGVDRTAGANAIRQDLDNLNEAGSLYGAIIYQKAPMVMRMLEQRIGEITFQDGIREYLERFAFGNATWPELIEILDARSPEDLASWSEAWVEEPGRPVVDVQIADGVLRFEESDPFGRGLTWPQEHTAIVFSGDGAAAVAAGEAAPEGAAFILPNAAGQGYADYRLGAAGAMALLEGAPRLEAPVDRGAAWLTLHDAVLNGTLSPVAFLEQASLQLPNEPVELLRQHIGSRIRGVYWGLLAPSQREAWAPRLEGLFDTMRTGSETPGERNAWYQAWQDVALSNEAIARMEQIWISEVPPEGVTLSEWDYAGMARELALRGIDVLEAQSERLTDRDRKRRFEASMEAGSPDPAVREAWFARLADVENRAVESQVLEGMRMLHHALRARESEHLIRPALDLTLEIQRTGDIFFPGRWLHATLDGHQTGSAAGIVRAFVEGLPEDYPEKLKGKVLQAADGVYRAAEISEDWRP